VPIIINSVERIAKVWRDAFFDYLEAVPQAKTAYESLEDGCGRTTLLSYLHLYTGPIIRGYVQHQKSEAQRTRKALERYLRLLKKTGKESKGLTQGTEGDVLCAQIGTSLQCEFETVLNKYAERLAALCKEYAKRASQRGKNRNEVYLVLLWLWIKHRTGEPHWGDLAYVLEAAYAAQNQEVHLDAFAVRQIVRRYKAAYPERFGSYVRRVPTSALAAHPDRDLPPYEPPRSISRTPKKRVRKKRIFLSPYE
jgi:hypothetical protein